jgi:hypothetical protein
MYLANELLPYCLKNIIDDPAELDKAHDGISRDQNTAIASVLKEILLRESETGDVTATALHVEQEKVLHSILAGGAISSSDKLVAFSFTNAAKESALHLLGLVFAVSSSGHWEPKNLPQTLGAASSLWKNLVILHSPQDDDAIATARAIGILRLRSKWEPQARGASNQALLDFTGFSTARLADALKTLHELHVIEPMQWGNQSNDYTHGGNCWRIGF